MKLHVRFLADESCDFLVVRALRGAGHDVRALTEETSQTIDEEVIRLGASEQRVLLTEDKDFGWLAFVTYEESHGVVLIRYRGDARHALGEAIMDLVAVHGDRLSGAFTVLEPGRARILTKPTKP